MTNDTQPKTGKILLLSAGHLINDSYMGFLAPILPLLMYRFDLSLTMTAFLATILSFTASFIQPIQGYLADKFNWRYYVALGPLVTSIFMSMIGLAPNYMFLVIFLIISGIGTSTFHPQAAIMVAQNSGNRSGFGMSVFVTAGSLGVALGPPIILLIIKSAGFQYSFISVIPGLIIAFLLFLYAPEMRSQTRQAESTASNKLSLYQSLSITLLTLIAIIRAFVIIGLTNFSPILLSKQNFPEEFAGLSVTLFLIFGALGTLIGGPLADKVGRKTVILASVILSVPFNLGFLELETMARFCSFAMAGFTISISIPATILMAQELTSNYTATASSLVMGFSWGIAGLLLTPFGALGDTIGLTAALQALSFVPLLIIFLVVPIPSPK